MAENQDGGGKIIVPYFPVSPHLLLSLGKARRGEAGNIETYRGDNLGRHQAWTFGGTAKQGLRYDQPKAQIDWEIVL